MASSLAEKINDNFLQCGICLEPFRNPRVLPCLHSFCEECLERWAKTNKEKKSKILICPNCKKPTQIPAEGVQGFPAHFLVNSLQETVNMEKAKEDYDEKICSRCNKSDIKANVYCHDCKHFLCKSCFGKHKTWDAMKDHRVVTIEDLSSGKVTLSEMQDQHCTEHEGEKKRFYCETCGKPVCRDCIVLKQCCRDHDTVPLKQASDKQVSHLKEAMMICGEKKQKFQDALDKTKMVEDELCNSASMVKAELDETKRAYMQALESMFSQFKSNVDKLKEDRNKQLSETKVNLQTKLTQLEYASERGKTLTENASPYDIMCEYQSVLSTLQKVNQIQIGEVKMELSNVPTPELTCRLSRQWKQTNQFKVAAGNALTGIAVTSSGEVAVCLDYYKLQVFSQSGELKHTFPNDDGSLGGLGDVSITESNVYIIPKFEKFCKLFNSHYKQLLEFKTYNAKGDLSEARAVTVDKNGCIVLGMEDNAISIHNADGSLKSSFAISSGPRSVTVTSEEKIVVATDNYTLQLLDYSGKSIQTIDPPPEVDKWCPQYVCCSKTDEVFVVNRGDPKATYKYAAGRVYMGCVTTEVNDPFGIALSHDDQELFVTEYTDNVVKIFKRP